MSEQSVAALAAESPVGALVSGGVLESVSDASMLPTTTLESGSVETSVPSVEFAPVPASLVIEVSAAPPLSPCGEVDPATLHATKRPHGGAAQRRSHT
jgi:hypothetical protein